VPLSFVVILTLYYCTLRWIVVPSAAPDIVPSSPPTRSRYRLSSIESRRHRQGAAYMLLSNPSPPAGGCRGGESAVCTTRAHRCRLVVLNLDICFCYLSVYRIVSHNFRKPIPHLYVSQNVSLKGWNCLLILVGHLHQYLVPCSPLCSVGILFTCACWSSYRFVISLAVCLSW
jgi:hypothetical protein